MHEIGCEASHWQSLGSAITMPLASFWIAAISSIWDAARLLSSLSIGLALVVVTYRLHFHPLANVPGPRWAAVSNVWDALQVRNGRVGQLAIALHQKYGDAVRVGPNEVWFNSKEAFAQIYGTVRLQRTWLEAAAESLMVAVQAHVGDSKSLIFIVCLPHAFCTILHHSQSILNRCHSCNDFDQATA